MNFTGGVVYFKPKDEPDSPFIALGRIKNVQMQISEEVVAAFCERNRIAREEVVAVELHNRKVYPLWFEALKLLKVKT